MGRRLVLLLIFALALGACTGDDSAATTAAPTTATAEATTTTVAELEPEATLDLVRARQRLICGVGLGIPGLAEEGPRGEVTGLTIDMCKAVAATVLGDAANIDFVPLDPGLMVDSLVQGEVDLLTHFTTWTLSRDVGLPVDFGPTYYFDGLGLIVAAADHAPSDGLDSLAGGAICATSGTTSEANVRSAINESGLDIGVRTYAGADALIEGFRAGECDAASLERTVLELLRGAFFDDPADGLVLDLVLAQEPLGPVYREGDPEWADIVNWTMFALIIAEEKGITQSNVDTFVADSSDPAVRTLFAGEGLAMPQSMKLDPDAFRRVIATVGNYGEIFERHLGPYGIARGDNALWSDGGLMFAPPAR